MKKKSNLWLWVKTSLLVLLVICAYSCSVMSDSEDDADKFSYLAVQMEKDGNWSIIDGDGKVIVKDEYPADNFLCIPLTLLRNRSHQLIMTMLPILIMEELSSLCLESLFR